MPKLNYYDEMKEQKKYYMRQYRINKKKIAENLAKREECHKKYYLAARDRRSEMGMPIQVHIKGHKTNWHDFDLKRRYGITANDYKTIFDRQSGNCAICGEHQSEIKKRLHVDHDHNTGAIRGLLCYNCNLMVGNSHDNPDLLRKGAEYLENGKDCQNCCFTFDQ